MNQKNKYDECVGGDTGRQGKMVSGRERGKERGCREKGGGGGGRREGIVKGGEESENVEFYR